MGRIYSATYSGTLTASGTDSDLIEIQPANNKPIKLLGFCLSQISEVGDAAEEGLRIRVMHLASSPNSGTGGTTASVGPADVGQDSATGATIEVNNTTVATTAGTTTTVLEAGWNIRQSPFDFWWRPGCEPKVVYNSLIVIRCETTVADDITFQITAWFEEL